MLRRSLLKKLGFGGLAAVASTPALAGRAVVPSRKEAGNASVTTIAGLDLRSVEAIDAHIHAPSDRPFAETLPAWGKAFSSAALSAGDVLAPPASPALQNAYADLFRRSPISVGLRNYVGRTHSVPPSDASVNAVALRHRGPGFASYYRRRMGEERITHLILQSSDEQPVRPKTRIADELFSWTYSLSPLLQPEWATARGIAAVANYVDEIERLLDDCVRNGCVGFKLPIAYYRPIAIGKVDRSAADAALGRVLQASPVGYRVDPTRNPVYADADTRAALWRYQDYLLRAIFLKAGALDIPVIIHSAVGVHPGLRFDFNDPRGLVDILTDRAVLDAGTRVVLIHAGHPQHHAVAALLNQFPNAFADVSFFSHMPGALEEIYRTFLGTVPSEKIMHGSDWSGAEAICYAVDNSRRVLAKVLGDYYGAYGWSAADCHRMARDVLNGTARRVFKLPAYHP